MPPLTLRIEVEGPASSWKARWSLDGKTLGPPFEVSGARAEAMTDLRRRFSKVFGARSSGTKAEPEDFRPMENPEYLRAMGRQLDETWFAPARDALKPSLEAPGPRKLVLRANDPTVLNLPWELVEFDPNVPVGCDANWALVRTSLTGRGVIATPPRPGPLRVLFLAAAPIDQHQLDYEQEEDLMVRAWTGIRGDIVAHFAETGTLDELADLVDEVSPHVVHLSGHGDIDDQGRGVFVFEDERGLTDLRTADEIARRVFRGREVRLAFLNGCRTSEAAVASLCDGLVAAGVPTALGWAASVMDDRAVDFATAFYRRLCRGMTASAASALGRETIRAAGRVARGDGKTQDASYALPRLYGGDAPLLDPSAPKEDYTGPRTEYTKLGDGIEGLSHGYVGRRREVQRLVPALRHGEATFALITGIGGVGKSTLATRAVNRLQSAGFRVVPIQVKKTLPAEAGADALDRLVKALATAFLREPGPKFRDLHRDLTDGRIDRAQRLDLAISGLNESKLVLVLDDFENALDIKTLKVADPVLANFVRRLADDLTHGSRVILTCRYRPADLPGGLLISLRDFPDHDFLKFLRRDKDVDRRIAARELGGGLIEAIYKTLGGTPDLLRQVRALLRTADPKALLDELNGGRPGPLAKLRKDYCNKILEPLLHDTLMPRVVTLASRLAISELPLPADAVALLIDGDITEPLAEGLAYGLIQVFEEPDRPPLYLPPGTLRPWLVAPERLGDDEAKVVHSHLAAFWRSSVESDREEDLRVAIEVELEACRGHSRQAGDQPTDCWATTMLARGLSERSEWHRARMLLEELPEAGRDGYAWHQLASIDLNQGDYAAAREGFARALAIMLDIGDRAGEADTLHQLATIDVYQGEYAAAREGFGRALAINRDIGDRSGEAATLHNLATIDLNQGDYAAAREGFGLALAIRRDIGDRSGEAATLHQLATIDVNQGDYAAAREGFGRALAIRRDIGDRSGEAATLHQLATIDVNQGDYAAAREGFGLALAIRRDIGDRAGEAATLHQLATIDLEQGEYEAARVGFGRALAIKRDIGDRSGEAATLHQLATIDLEQGEYEAAREGFARALAIKRDIGDRAGEAATLHGLATIDLEQGEYEAAREGFARALAIMRDIGDRAGEAATLHGLATIDLEQGEYEAAREGFARALAIMRDIGDRSGEAATWHQFGAIAIEMGREQSAIRFVALCWMIEHSIGHGDAEKSFRYLSGLGQSLGYSQEQFDAMLAEVTAAYAEDRGKRLIERAFAEGTTMGPPPGKARAFSVSGWFRRLRSGWGRRRRPGAD